MSASNGGDLTVRPFVSLTVKTWPEALRYCRVTRGFSHSEVGKEIKEPPETVKGWEFGKGEPNRSKLRLLYQSLPKLRNYSGLLPESLAHPETVEPTGEAAPPEAVAEVVKAKEEGRKSKLPDVATYRHFGEAMNALILYEGMRKAEFAELVQLSASRISSIIGNAAQTMTRITYDRLCEALPELKRAPPPPFSLRNWVSYPGGTRKDRPSNARVTQSPEDAAAAQAAAETAEKLARVRSAPPAELPPPAPPPSTRRISEITTKEVAPGTVTERGPVAELAAEINKAGAAYGLAQATVARLRQEIGIAERQVKECHERMTSLIGRLGALT